MSIPNTPIEKYEYIKETYLNDILPVIGDIYTKTTHTPEAFIILHCAILALSGFYSGSKKSTKKTYIKFITDFYSTSYNAEKLYLEVRCNLIHAYTVPKYYVLLGKRSDLHLKKVRPKNARTGKRSQFTFLNFEDFYKDTINAANKYFKKAKNDNALLTKLSSRYDIVPPNERTQI
jgi:hypothetical protein